MAEMPRAKDLFGDAAPVDAAKRMEEYTESLGKSLSNASSVPGMAPAADPVSALESLVSNKSLTGDALAGLNSALASQRTAMQDIQQCKTFRRTFLLHLHSAHLSQPSTSKRQQSCLHLVQHLSVTESHARRV